MELKDVKNGTKAVSTKSDTQFVIEDFNLQDKKLIYLTDNCPAMIKAFDNEQWYGCFLHIISLVQKHSFLNDKFSIISNLFAKCRRLVEYVNKSSKKKLFKPSLKQDVPTRFESIYRLISSISQNETNFELIKEEDKTIYDHYRKINMTVLDYTLKIANVFEECRLRMGVSSKSTFYLVYGVYHILKASLINLMSDISLGNDDLLDDEERKELIDLIEFFNIQLKEAYLKRITLDHKVSTLLTPQFVNLISSEIDVVNELQSRYRSKSVETEDSIIITQKIIDPFFNLIPTKKKRVAKKNEIDNFLESDFTDEEIASDPIDFWKLNQQKYPVLSSIAIELLTIPASSLYVESLFSKAGWTKNERRNLKPATLNALLFCNSNSDLLD